MKLEGKINQRFGQLLVNAVAEYLKSEDRFINDDEVAKCLFYMSGTDLNAIVDWYISVSNAKGSL